MQPSIAALLTVLGLSASAALAAEPLAPVLIEVHDATDEVAAPILAFSHKDGVVVSGKAGTRFVQVKRGKLLIESWVDQQPWSNPQTARTQSLGERGALAFIADSQKRLQIARFDVAARAWVALDRPIGFVDRGSSKVGHWVLFPQATTSPAWFVFDEQTGQFDRFTRPAEVSGCAGVSFAAGVEVAVVGEDDTGKPCALALAPESGRWRALAAPPERAGDTAVVADGKAYVIGERVTLEYDIRKERWRKLSGAPWAPAAAQVAAAAGRVGIWRFGRDRIDYAGLDPKSGKWTAVSEAIELDVALVVEVAADGWWFAGRRRGQPIVGRVTYAPQASRAELAAARPPRDEEPTARDWKKASEKEKHEAIRQGLGAVERYVPPARDPKTGKLVTKGAWVFALGEELVVWPVPPKSCRSFVEKLLAAWPTETVGVTWPVERGAGFARAGKRLLYGPGAECDAKLTCPADYFSRRATPLSQVGPIFSFAVHTSQAVECGESMGEERWVALDLRSQGPAGLDALVDPASVLDALRRHKEVGKLVSEAATLEEALSSLRPGESPAVWGYAFGGWRSMSGRVELFLEYHAKSTDAVTPIKILVRPKEEFVQLFEEAARTPGLLMGESM